jgi:polyhydroxyalkanoate synthesis regulator phasin
MNVSGLKYKISRLRIRNKKLSKKLKKMPEKYGTPEVYDIVSNKTKINLLSRKLRKLEKLKKLKKIEKQRMKRRSKIA